MNERLQQLMSDAPAWAREPAVLIGAGVVVALLVLWLLSRLMRRGGRNRIDSTFEEDLPVARPITPPPVTPPPPPLAAEPIAPPPLPPVAEPAPEPESFPAPAPQPFAAPEPDMEPAPDPVVAPTNEPREESPLADAPIAAAAPLDASPASIAADVPQSEPASASDDLTRMKGVGPRLAQHLNSLGITRFADIAALSPADADALDARLGDFQGRMHRDRWIEQAGYLASGDISGFEATFGKL